MFSLISLLALLCLLISFNAAFDCFILLYCCYLTLRLLPTSTLQIAYSWGHAPLRRLAAKINACATTSLISSNICQKLCYDTFYCTPLRASFFSPPLPLAWCRAPSCHCCHYESLAAIFSRRIVSKANFYWCASGLFHIGKMRFFSVCRLDWYRRFRDFHFITDFALINFASIN